MMAIAAAQGEGATSKVLELSEDISQPLTMLAEQQHCTLEEMLRVCLATYEAARYARVHEQMIAEGLLDALPTRPLPPEVEDFDPEKIPGPPLQMRL
jgi:predicted transcriptional regulator